MVSKYVFCYNTLFHNFNHKIDLQIKTRENHLPILISFYDL